MWAVIDTSVYIDYWERGLHEETRRHGATVVTANQQDFEILGRRLGVSIFAV